MNFFLPVREDFLLEKAFCSPASATAKSVCTQFVDVSIERLLKRTLHSRVYTLLAFEPKESSSTVLKRQRAPRVLIGLLRTDFSQIKLSKIFKCSAILMRLRIFAAKEEKSFGNKKIWNFKLGSYKSFKTLKQTA